MASDEEQTRGPEFQVWNHLWSGVEMASFELEVLSAEDRRVVDFVAKRLVDVRLQLTLARGSPESHFLDLFEAKINDPWIRHAAEIEIAGSGIARAEMALTRFLKIRPVIVSRPIPERAVKYLDEVVKTLIFGFDAACIALCRATLEQLLQEVLIIRGIYTGPQIKRERPTAGTLMTKAVTSGILGDSQDSARSLVKRGDTVMHSFIYDEKISEQQSLDSISKLLNVVATVFNSGDEATRA